MVSSLGARFFSTSSFSLLSIMGFRMPCSFWTWNTQKKCYRLCMKTDGLNMSHVPFTHFHDTGQLRPVTCSSVFRSPNSVMNVCSDGNLSGSRKLSKLKSSSTVFWRGVPVNNTLCSWRREQRPNIKTRMILQNLNCERNGVGKINQSTDTGLNYLAFIKVSTKLTQEILQKHKPF